jgi:protein ImuB
VRLACLYVPDFSLQALRRSRPDLAEAPVAITAGPAPRDRVVAVSSEAEELGVRAGVTAAQALQVAPEALLRVTPPEVTESAAGALADAAQGFSPRLCRGRPGEVLLDVVGLLPRWGSEGRIAVELLRACRRVGLEACVGVAGSVGVARAAAMKAGSRAQGTEDGTQGTGDSRHPAASRALRPAPCAPEGGWEERPGLIVVPPDAERAFMAALPLQLLGPAPRLAESLARWGIGNAGELAALPRKEVALRLGAEGVALHRLAAGEEEESFVPDAVREELREGIALEHPVTSLEPFLFVLHGLLSRLAQRLELRGEGFAEVVVELALESGGRHELPVTLVAATREVPAVQSMVRLRIEARPSGAPVEGIAVRVVPGRLRLVQGSLFGPPQPAPGKLAQALARLAALVGPERVGAPALADTHRPGAWNVVPFAPREEGDRAQGTGLRGEGLGLGAQGVEEGSAPVLRAFRPPLEARVVTAGARPVAARVDGIGGVVVGLAGPYRFVGEWWSEQPFARDDYDIATADGAVWRVYYDRLARRWFADGVYD